MFIIIIGGTLDCHEIVTLNPCEWRERERAPVSSSMINYSETDSSASDDTCRPIDIDKHELLHSRYNFGGYTAADVKWRLDHLG